MDSNSPGPTELAEVFDSEVAEGLRGTQVGDMIKELCRMSSTSAGQTETQMATVGSQLCTSKSLQSDDDMLGVGGELVSSCEGNKGKPTASHSQIESLAEMKSFDSSTLRPDLSDSESPMWPLPSRSRTSWADESIFEDQTVNDMGEVYDYIQDLSLPALPNSQPKATASQSVKRKATGSQNQIPGKRSESADYLQGVAPKQYLGGIEKQRSMHNPDLISSPLSLAKTGYQSRQNLQLPEPESLPKVILVEPIGDGQSTRSFFANEVRLTRDLSNSAFGLAGIDTVSKNVSRNLLIVTIKQMTAKKLADLLAIKKIGSYQVSCRLPQSKQITYGVIGPIGEETDPMEILQLLSDTEPAVEAVSRITKGKEKTPTKCMRLTFSGQVLPEYVNIGYQRFPVRLFIDRAWQCFKCQDFGHNAADCKGKERCVVCSGPHRVANCPNKNTKSPMCSNCKGAHTASYGGCPFMKRAKEVEQVRARRKLSYRDALQYVRSANNQPHSNYQTTQRAQTSIPATPLFQQSPDQRTTLQTRGISPGLPSTCKTSVQKVEVGTQTNNNVVANTQTPASLQEDEISKIVVLVLSIILKMQKPSGKIVCEPENLRILVNSALELRNEENVDPFTRKEEGSLSLAQSSDTLDLEQESSVPIKKRKLKSKIKCPGLAVKSCNPSSQEPERVTRRVGLEGSRMNPGEIRGEDQPGKALEGVKPPPNFMGFGAKGIRGRQRVAK